MRIEEWQCSVNSGCRADDIWWDSSIGACDGTTNDAICLLRHVSFTLCCCSDVGCQHKILVITRTARVWRSRKGSLFSGSLNSMKSLIKLMLISEVEIHSFNCPFSVTTWVSRYQKGKTNLDFTEARDSEWQWHQLGHMQVCISLQTDNHVSTPPLSFLQAGCPSWHPTNSVKALEGWDIGYYVMIRCVYAGHGKAAACHSDAFSVM